MAKNYTMEFLLGAQLSGSFSGAFNRAQQTITNLQGRIQNLQKTQSDINAYQRQQAAIDSTNSKLTTLCQKYDNIQKEIAETEGFSSKLENSLLTTQQQIDKTTGSLGKQYDALDKTGEKLRDAGVNTDDLGNAAKTTAAKIDELKTKQEEAADKAEEFGNKSTKAFQELSSVLAGAGVLSLLDSIKDKLMECIDASMEFQTAMTGVDKTVDLTTQEYAAMSEEIKKLATEIPATTTELAGIGEVAGQLGIQKDNILEFTRIMAMLGTATNMTAAEGATLLAQFANITQMDPSQYMNLGSTVVALGNTFATTEQKITEMSQGIAAAGSIAGMSEADIMGLSAGISSLGIESAMGASSMSKLIAEINAAVETGEGLTDFAFFSGMSAAEFSAAWGEDAAGALAVFVQGLSDTERTGMSATQALNELGITEIRMQRMILSLAEAGGLLTRAIDTANNAWDKNNALTREAEKRYATMQSQLTMMQNSWNNCAVAVGDLYAPALTKLYSIFGDLGDGIAGFISQNEELCTILSAVAVGIGAVIAVGSALTIFMTLLPKIIALWETLVIAMSFNPMMLLITAIVGVVAALGFLALSYESANKEVYDHVEALKESKEAYESTFAEIDDAVSSIDILAAKVAELGEKSNKTASDEAVLEDAIGRLNEQVPGMALAYDKATGSINMTGDAVLGLAKKQAEQQRQEAKVKRLTDLYVEQEETAELLAKKQVEVAEQGAGAIGDITDLALMLGWGMNEEEAAVAGLQANLDYLNQEVKNFETELDLAAEAENTAEGAANVLGAALANLQLEYREAAAEALASIQSQYEIWDVAAQVIPTSIATINQALASQTEYWTQYGSNMEILLEKAAQIPGLADVIASFDPTTTEGVQAIAGMAQATDEDLRLMVSKFQELTAAETTAMEKTGLMTADVSGKLEGMAEDFAESVESMDLSEESAAAASATITAFSNALDAPMQTALSKVQTFAQKISAALAGAGGGAPGVTPVITPEGNAAGTTNAADVFIAGERGPELVVGAGGSTVFPHSETEQILRAVEQEARLMSFMQMAIPLGSGKSVESSGMDSLSSSGRGEIVFAPVFNISGVKDAADVEAVLNDQSEKLRELFYEFMTEAEIDAKRRAY